MPPMAIPMGPTSPKDRPSPVVIPPPSLTMSDAVAKDSIIAWFRGEFAAANAIIDALCGHLAEFGGSEYDSVFSAVHRRRLNWIPVLQMQKYHSIADVAMELRRATENRIVMESVEEVKDCLDGEKVNEKMGESDGNDLIDNEITDSGLEKMEPISQNVDICSNHEDCEVRSAQIKLTKGFSAKEPVKGHMVNVVKGLKLYEDILTDAELSKLSDFVNELRIAGQSGDLSGESYKIFNKQMKGNKRELIQFGTPIFGQIKDEATSNNETGNLEPIPALLQSVIDHLVQWKLLPEYKRPNSCIINFFDEGEYSQPFLKPPHLDQPISTLFISESTMALGRILVSDNDGNYKGPLMLSLKKGSVLVMRGNSADMAGHVMCPSPNRRVSITFFRVRPDSNQGQSSPTSPLNTAMTLWQPNLPNGALNGYEALEVIPKWEVLRSPLVMLAPVRPMVLSPRKLPCGGTGVFLPWTMASRKPTKHLPPRAQKGRLLAIPSSLETNVSESTSAAGVSVEGN